MRTESDGEEGQAPSRSRDKELASGGWAPWDRSSHKEQGRGAPAVSAAVTPVAKATPEWTKGRGVL